MQYFNGLAARVDDLYHFSGLQIVDYLIDTYDTNFAISQNILLHKPIHFLCSIGSKKLLDDE